MNGSSMPHIMYEGYMSALGEPLAAPLSMEDALRMGAASADAFPAPCFVFGRATSTFDLAWALNAAKPLPAWGSTVAMAQDQGRGQVRREWHSPPGNLYVSFFLPDDFLPMEGMASLYTGYLVHAALGAMGMTTFLKWPNDIIIDDGKVGGILLEERHGRLLAGLGLNIATAPTANAMRPGSALPAARLPVTPVAVCEFWRDLSAHMQKRHADMAFAPLGEIRETVTASLAWRGRAVYADEADCVGVLSGLADDGALLLLSQDRYVTVTSGSVRLAE